MRLFMVRHGESTWNVEGRYQGRRDAPLSPRGRAQALALASRLAGERISAVVASPLRRARETAEICAQAAGLAATVDDRLTEISHGAWEGKLRSDVAVVWPELLAAWQTSPHLVQFPGGESLDDVRTRLEDFLDGLDGTAQPLLAVTHDVVVRLAVLAAQHKPLSSFHRVQVDNAALNEFALEGGKLVAVRLNVTEHLGSLRSDTLTQAL